MPITTTDWDLVTVTADAPPRDPGLLRALIAGDHAVVLLRGLLPASLLDTERSRVNALFSQASTTRYTNGTLTTIGPYLAKYLANAADYFPAADAATEMLQSASFDLAARVRAELCRCFGLASLGPAREPDGRRYGDSVVRIHADGVSNPLHNDNIMRDAAGTGLALSHLAHQLSCIVCIQECDSGGELAIYRKPWAGPDEEFKIPGGLGYDKQVVADTPCYTFRPQTGDVYLINPTYYHEIGEVAGAPRTTLGFFIGFGDGPMADAVVWG